MTSQDPEPAPVRPESASRDAATESASETRSRAGSSRDSSPPVEARYSRQVLFQEIGEAGQRRLAQGTALIAGCGALGCTIADVLVRAGVGRVRIVDRDLVEESNLQRQILFDENDARAVLPKAEAAAAKLRAANSRITIEPFVADLTADTIAGLAEGIDVLVDGTDNFETRYLLNDWSVREGVPWIYGAAVGSYGVTMSVLPNEGPCLSCLFESSPPPGTSPTCETAGILASAALTIGSIEAAEAIKLLAGRRDTMSGTLTVVDVWEGRFERLGVERRKDPPCPTCGLRQFPHLDGSRASRATTLCGRNSVQVTPPGPTRIDLRDLADRWSSLGPVDSNRFLVRARLEGLELTLFRDGRAIVSGTKEPERARAVYARYVGS